MVSKKTIIGSILLAVLFIGLGIATAIIRKFDLLSSILLGLSGLISIVAIVTAVRELIDQKKDREKDDLDKED